MRPASGALHRGPCVATSPGGARAHMGARTNGRRRLGRRWCLKTTTKGVPVQTLMSHDVTARAALVRLAVLDDHQAVRAGLEYAIRSERGIACVGTASDAEQLAPRRQERAGTGALHGDPPCGG